MAFFRLLDLRLVHSIYWATAGSDFEDRSALDERAVRVDVRIDEPSALLGPFHMQGS